MPSSCYTCWRVLSALAASKLHYVSGRRSFQKYWLVLNGDLPPCFCFSPYMNWWRSIRSVALKPWYTNSQWLPSLSNQGNNLMMLCWRLEGRAATSLLNSSQQLPYSPLKLYLYFFGSSTLQVASSIPLTRMLCDLLYNFTMKKKRIESLYSYYIEASCRDNLIIIR